MQHPKFLLLTFVIFSVMTALCSPKKNAPREAFGRQAPSDRQPWAAGKFYPADSVSLSTMLEGLFKKASPKDQDHVLALISPHAGYAYSGEVAATAFAQLDREKTYDHIFLIASSHRAWFDGASIYNLGDYVTPLGKVKVDKALADRLISENPVFRSSPAYHEEEHSLEVQLPFLQYWLKKEFSVIPVILGTDDPEGCKKVAAALKPYFNNNNLFVISTDFSHYPAYKDAEVIDRRTARAISLNSPDSLLHILEDNEGSKVNGLATSLCGRTSVLSLLYMSEKIPGIEISPILYRNSGDTEIGDRERVVGYYAMTVKGDIPRQQEESGISLSHKDKQDLLSLARRTLETYLKIGELVPEKGYSYSDNLHIPMGAFVTLMKKGELRGCIGRFSPEEPLFKVVQLMAVAAATRDNRFQEVRLSELPKIKIEISVLTPMVRISSPEEIILGKHGIYVKKGWKTGTYLPQVARETGWTKEEFLSHCAHDKAGLDWDEWKDAEIYVYEALVFEEE